MHEIVEFCRAREHPLPGPRLGGQLGGLLLPRHHRGRSGAHGAAVRALPLARARRAARHRPRHRARAARGGDPARLRRSTAASHAAMVANVIRYRPRSAVRDVGKALGLSETDARPRWRSCSSHYERRRRRDRCAQAGLDPRQRRRTSTCCACADEILDFPRHLSIHPGGFLLGHEPVHDLVPIENAHAWPTHRHPVGQGRRRGARPVQGRPAGPRRAHPSRPRASTPAGSTAASSCRWRRSRRTTSRRYDMICRGDTVGVFQIESRAQMAMLPRLRPRNFYDLVIEVSIVRPGPITGGMVHPYLRRRARRGAGRVSARLPRAGAREDARRAAVPGAGDAPRGGRRRLHAGRGRPAAPRHGRVAEAPAASSSTASGSSRGCRRRASPREFAERVFEQIRGFGEYGFPESHAASFALSATRPRGCACHHPAEFTCALLNAQPMGFYSAADDRRRRQAARRRGAADRRRSRATGTARSRTGNAVRMGLRYVKGCGAGGRAVGACGPRAAAVRRRSTTSCARAGARRAHAHVAGGGRRVREPRAAAGARRSGKCRGLARARAGAAGLDRRRGGRRLCRALDAFETIAWDYRALVAQHRAAIRWRRCGARSRAQGLPDAQTIGRLPHGRAGALRRARHLPPAPGHRRRA